MTARLSDPYQGPGTVGPGAKEGSEMARLSDPYQGLGTVGPGASVAHTCQ